MNIAHSETIPWGPVRTLRGGSLRFKTLLEGAERTPTNFSMVLADTDISFKSPRHRHNFDQIRITLEGSTNFGPRQNIEVGDVAYFPEGTHYGPQDQELTGRSSLAMVIQFGGASGNGYMSQRQLFEGQERMKAFGRFEAGVFRREQPGPDGRKNQDAYEAVWEFQHDRALEYPRPRMTEPVHFRAANVPWTPAPRWPGVHEKELGAFTERAIRIGAVKLDPGAGMTLADDGQERILFFTQGKGEFAGGGQWFRHTAVHLGRDEAPALRASEATEALVLALPRF
jgi:quercetin dioxygenase-like cupin family protein